ncbi:MAG: DUF3352 domain-containing protein [Phormidesmis sp.]
MNFRDVKRALKQDHPEWWVAGLLALSVLPALPAVALAEVSADPAVVGQQQLAQQLPENTPIAFFLTTQPQGWQALEQFELFAKIAEFTGGEVSPVGLGIFLPGFDYASEIRPWIGDQVAVTVLPDTTPRSISATDIAGTTLTVVPVANPQALPPFLERLETARADEVPTKSTYEGVALWVWPTRTESYDDYYEVPEPLPLGDHNAVPEAGTAKAATSPVPQRLPVPSEPAEGDYTYQIPGLAVAISDDYLIFAREPAAVKTLIDYQRLGRPTLGDSELFERSQYTDTQGALARFYANLSEVVKFDFDGGLSGLTPLPFPLPFPRPLPGSPERMPQLSLPLETRSLTARALQGVTIDSLVYPQAEGIRLQGRLYGNDLVRSIATPDRPEADSALSFVPAPAYGLSSGRNLAGLWRQIAARLALSEFTREFLQQARSTVSTFLGLDLDSELLGWMDQEVVLFFFPSEGGGSFLPEFNLETGIALQTSDRATAQKALDALDAFIGSSAVSQNLSVTITEINGTPAVSWQIPAYPGSAEPLSVFSHSWIAEDTVMLTSGTRAMAQLLNAPNFQSVERYPTFLNATESLPYPNNGYSYLNAGSTLSLIYSLFDRWLELSPDDPIFQTVKSYLGTIRGFGSTTSSTQEYWQLDTLMNLAPAQGAPLPPAATDSPAEPAAE